VPNNPSKSPFKKGDLKHPPFKIALVLCHTNDHFLMDTAKDEKWLA
jgi:hypothetical protein